MISNQVLQNTLEGLREISRTEFCIIDTDGKTLASTYSEFEIQPQDIQAFVESQAASQLVKGYQYFKVCDDYQLEYILVAHGEDEDTYMVGKISVKNHPFVEHFKFVKALEDENTVAKQTIPSPGQFYAYFTGAELLYKTIEIYGSEEAFAEDVIKAYSEFVQEIYAAGCRNLQFDDCVWGGMVDAKMAVALTGRRGDKLEEYKKLLLELNNQVVAQAPEDLVINTHVCRGNYHSTFFSSGAYDSVADLLFGEENVNAYYLEYDDKRSGGFAPLAKVSGDKKVVLGLITTKIPQLEDKGKVIARIHEAEKYVPLDRLYLSPQCGFASCEIGNKLTEEEQWEKLKLVKEIAEEVWGDR